MLIAFENEDVAKYINIYIAFLLLFRNESFIVYDDYLDLS